MRVVSQKQSGLMHHKFALVEGRVVITGSFKWTNQVWLSRLYCIYSPFFSISGFNIELNIGFNKTFNILLNIGLGSILGSIFGTIYFVRYSVQYCI